MTTVGVTIAGRTYRVACNEGEEAHLQDLARHVDHTLKGLRQGFGEIGDQRLVIMTAITVADELSESKRRIAELERELADLATTRSETESIRLALAEDVAASIDAATQRIEQLVQQLNAAR